MCDNEKDVEKESDMNKSERTLLMLGEVERRLQKMNERFESRFQEMEERFEEIFTKILGKKASLEIKISPDVRKIDAARVRYSGDAEQEGTTFEHGTDSEIFYGTSSDSDEERDSIESEEVLDTRLNATSIFVDISVPVIAQGKFFVDSLQFSDQFLDSDNDRDSDSNSESSNSSGESDSGPNPNLDSSHDPHSSETDSREGMMVPCSPLYGEHTSDMVNVICDGAFSREENSYCSSDDSSHAQSIVWEQDDDEQDIDDYLQGGDSYYSPDPGYLSNGCDSDYGY